MIDVYSNFSFLFTGVMLETETIRTDDPARLNLYGQNDINPVSGTKSTEMQCFKIFSNESYVSYYKK